MTEQGREGNPESQRAPGAGYDDFAQRRAELETRLQQLQAEYQVGSIARQRTEVVEGRQMPETIELQQVQADLDAINETWRNNGGEAVATAQAELDNLDPAELNMAYYDVEAEKKAALLAAKEAFEDSLQETHTDAAASEETTDQAEHDEEVHDLKAAAEVAAAETETGDEVHEGSEPEEGAEQESDSDATDSDTETHDDASAEQSTPDATDTGEAASESAPAGDDQASVESAVTDENDAPAESPDGSAPEGEASATDNEDHGTDHESDAPAANETEGTPSDNEGDQAPAEPTPAEAGEAEGTPTGEEAEAGEPNDEFEQEFINKLTSMLGEKIVEGMSNYMKRRFLNDAKLQGVLNDPEFEGTGDLIDARQVFIEKTLAMFARVEARESNQRLSALGQAMGGALATGGEAADPSSDGSVAHEAGEEADDEADGAAGGLPPIPPTPAFTPAAPGAYPPPPSSPAAVDASVDAPVAVPAGDLVPVGTLDNPDGEREGSHEEGEFVWTIRKRAIAKFGIPAAFLGRVSARLFKRHELLAKNSKSRNEGESEDEYYLRMKAHAKTTAAIGGLAILGGVSGLAAPLGWGTAAAWSLKGASFAAGVGNGVWQARRKDPAGPNAGAAIAGGAASLALGFGGNEALEHGLFSGGGGMAPIPPSPGNGNHDVAPPQGTNGNMPPDYFNRPNTALDTLHLHHPNDFSPGNPQLANGDLNGAVDNLDNMFRGNPNITSMWASQLHINGAPNMPSYADLNGPNGPALRDAFNVQVNDYANNLRGNPQLWHDTIGQMEDLLKNGKLGNHQTLDDYISAGSNNTGGDIFDTQKGQVFLDTDVEYSGTDVVEWHLSNGQTILVETGCNQISLAEMKPVSAPAPYHPQPQAAAPLAPVVEGAPAPAAEVIPQQGPDFVAPPAFGEIPIPVGGGAPPPSWDHHQPHPHPQPHPTPTPPTLNGKGTEPGPSQVTQIHGGPGDQLQPAHPVQTAAPGVGSITTPHGTAAPGLSGAGNGAAAPSGRTGPTASSGATGASSPAGGRVGSR